MTTQLYSIEEINKVYADRDALLAALISCLRQMADPDPIHPAYRQAQSDGVAALKSRS